MIQKVPCLNSFCLSEKDRGGEKGRGGGKVVLRVGIMIKGLLPHTSPLIQIGSKKNSDHTTKHMFCDSVSFDNFFLPTKSEFKD